MTSRHSLVTAICALTERDRLKAINADLLVALEFYADPDIVIGRIIDGKIVAEPENNETALAAITKAKLSK